MNVLTSDFNYQLAILYASKVAGVKSEYVELGNEFYLGDSDNRLVFSNVDHYAEKAMEWSSRIKSIPPFSSTTIAALGSESDSDLDPGRRRLWLGRLLENLNGNSDIDAITIHQYLKAKYTGQNNNIVCPNSGVNVADIRSAFANVILESRELVNDEIAQIANAGKETWVTEFNLLDTKHAVHGTWFHALFTSSMLLTYLEGNNVTKIMPHTLAGDGIFSGMYSNTSGLNFGGNGDGFLGPINCSLTIGTRAWELTALGNAVSLIATAANAATEVRNIDFPGAFVLDQSVSPDIYEVSGWYFHREAGSGDFIIVNYDEANITIDLGAILQSNNTLLGTSGITFKWQTLSAGIWEYAKGNASPADIPNDDEITLTTLNNLTQIISLPPYSITRISINPIAPIVHVDLNKTEFCCHEMLNVRVSNVEWSEGYFWSINNVIVENNDNPFYVEIPELTSTTNQNIKLHNYLGNVVWTSDFLVNRCPTSISIASNLDEFCPGDQIHLTSSATATFSNPWQYHWTPTTPILNGDVNVKDAYANPTHTTMFRQYVTDGTCWLVSNDLTVSSLNPEPYFSKTELKVCNTTSPKNVKLEVEFPDGISGTGFSYEWKDEAGAICSTCTTNVYPYPHTNQDKIFTVTVTSPSGCSGTATVQVLGVECCQPSIPNLPPDLDLTGTIPATVTNDKVFLDNLLSSLPSLPNGVTYNPDESVEINCTSGNGITDIYINRKLNVDLETTLIGCTLHIGEEAEINLYGNSDLVLMGCSLITCDNNVYTWKGATAAGENQMIVSIPFGGVNTYISNAETAIDLSDKAKFVIAGTHFFNNLNAINLHDYPSIIKFKEDGYTTANGVVYDLNNIYDNTFNSGGTWPSGFSDKGLLNAQYGISCSWIEGLIIGHLPFGLVPLGNDFKNSVVGVSLYNSTATFLSNTFDEIHYALPGQAKYSGIGILSTNGDPLNAVNVTIGDISNSNSGNVFNDVNNSIVIQDGGKFKISHNYFGGASITGRNVFDIMLEEIVGCDIEIVNNEFESVQTGIYGYNIYPGSKLDIVGNHFTDPEPTVGNPNFRHTAITLQNQQQFNNEEIRIISNVVNNLRIGIHLNNTSGAFVISNDVNLNFTTTTALTDPHTGILTEGCDDLNIIENDIMNSNYAADRDDMLRGISIDQGLRNTLRCNSLLNLGYTLKLNGNCNPSILEKNTFTAYDVGVYYASASVGNQGNASKAQDNVWIPFGTTNNNKVDGFSPTIDVWFHWGSTLGTGNNFSPWPHKPNLISPIGNNPHNNLECNLAENTEYEMDRFLASLVVDSQNTDADQQFIVAERLFRLMRNDSAFMAMNPLSYTQLSDLYYTFINSSSEYLNNVENYLSRQSNDSAEVLLAVVVDTNLIQESDKYIFETICRVNNKDSLLLEDSLYLTQLAHSYSYRVGRATFSASALTFTERKPTATSSLRMLNSKQKETKIKTKIEPNPTQQCIWITVPNDSYKEYIILNTQGKEVGLINVQDNENKLRYCFPERISDPNLLLIGKDEGGNILDVTKVIIIK